jgi:hypothetical protein
VASIYTARSLRKSPSRCLLKVLHSVHTLAWSQWDHRNTVLHRTDQPRLKKAISILDDLIIHQFQLGPQDLPLVDRHHFANPLGALLFQSTAYKQAWYTNVLAARQRQDRRADDLTRVPTDANQRILSWIRTGYLR